nr:chromosome segregation ATPase [uncultured Capnocytophaga sp.]
MATTIAQLDIDIDEVTKKAGETRKRLMEIAEEMKNLKKNFAEGNVSVDEYTQQLSKLTATQREAQKDLRSYEGIMQAQIATNDEAMQANNVLTGSIRELSAALSQNKKIYSELSAVQRESAEGRALLATIQQQDKAYKDLQKSIGNNQVEVGNYKQAILDALGDNQLFGQSLNGIIGNLEALKDRFSGMATILMNYINTGKIKQQTDEAAAVATEAVGTAMESTSAATAATSTTMSATATATAATGTAMNATTAATTKTSLAMKIFRGALISTGLGAIIVLLGSLIAYFTSTQEGVDKVARAITPLKVVFQTLWGVIQNFGKALVEVFTSPQKAIEGLMGLLETLWNQVSNRVTGVWDIIKGVGDIVTGDVEKGLKKVGNATLQVITGVDNVVEKVGNSVNSMKDTINEALERGAKIEKINQQLAASEADFIEQTAILKQQFKEQNRIAEDITKTFQEREEAARKSIEIQRSINRLAKDRNNLEQELLNLKFASNDTSDADRAELAKKKAELAEQTAAMLEAETTQNNKVNTIHKAMLDEQKKQREEANKRYMEMLKERLAAEKQAIDVYVESNSAVAKSLEERLQIEEKGMKDRLAVLEDERKKGLVSRREYEDQKRKLEQDFSKTKVDLSVNAVQQELAMYEQMNQSKIGKEGRLTMEMVTQEQQRQAAIYQMKVEAMDKEKQLKEEANQWDYEQQQAHEMALLQLKQEREVQSMELMKQLKAQQREDEKERLSLEFQDRLLTLQEEGATQWDIEAEQMSRRHEEEMRALEQLLEDKKITEEAYRDTRSQLERKHNMEDLEQRRKVEEGKMQLATSALSQAKQLFGEHTAVGKAAAIAEATINTYLGITKALSAYPPPYNAIMAGVTGAMGFMNVNKIMSTTVKYAEGGPVSGRSHAEGGVPFSVAGVGGYEMEGGEYVVNKKATARFFPILELINNSTRHGGRNPFYFAQGDIVRQAKVSTHIDLTELTEAVRSGALQGTHQGALEGTQEGAYQGAREGATQGTYEGATAGTSEGMVRSGVIAGNNSNFLPIQYV